MFEKTKKEPELGFTNKKEIFEFDKEYSYINQIYFENHEITENDVCKVQTITNLKQVNHLFENLEKNEMTKSEDGTYFYSNTRGIGDRCFICKENDEIKVKTYKREKNCNTFNTKFGLMKCVTNGEFGGYISNYIEGDEKIAGFGNYEYIFEYKNKVYALTTLKHLNISWSSLHEIRKHENHFENITICSNMDLNFAGYYVEDNYLYFYSTSEFNGLYKFDLENNKLKIIDKWLCHNINVTSLIKDDNYIYIYGNYNIIQYNLDTNEIEKIYTNRI